MLSRMPFGCYKNKPINELPSDYIVWLLCLNDLREPLLSAIEHEADRRMGTVAQPERMR